MNVASWKFDDGHNNPSKSFPVRRLVRRKKEDAAHWLVAYRKAEEQNYKTLQRRIKETCKKYESSGAVSRPGGATLDGPFLLQLHGVDKPSELCFVDISEQKLKSVKPDDLRLFDSVAYVDASVNFLSVDSFCSFVSLRELNLSLNGLCNVTFDAADFPHLKVLDVSYNCLSAEDIISFGRLPFLKILHLTGNRLHHLPPDLGSSSDQDPTHVRFKDDTHFNALEVLMLDDNKLSSGVFNSLANLRRLEYLNLQRNRISEIPYLRPADYSGPALLELNPDLERVLPESCKEQRRGSCSPLPALQFLDLSDNKIAEEEALLAAVLLPELREIDIRSNPLTARTSGDPPLLQYHLQQRRGIAIKRRNVAEVLKRPLRITADRNWKANKRISKLSKKPCKVTVKTTPESESKKHRDETFQGNTEHFFVTQATDIPEHEFDLQNGEKQPSRLTERDEGEANSDGLLMDAKQDPDVVESVGIQTAVRMLEHTLKNLNVYRDSKPKLDGIQTPYRQRQKRIKELPPLRTMKHPNERIDEMIKEIRESRTMTEACLSSFIHSTSVNKIQRKEALRLLRDLETKYELLHQKSMERAAGNESD
ncbi:X-ray radiation resistance-associated protein 1 [Aulostomus maculatus]